MTQSTQLRILLVEDDGGIAHVIKIGLTTLGFPYTLDHAVTAEEAYERWSQASYDLVLSDYNLRGRNGLDLIEQIKQSGSNVPTVLVTAYDTATIRRAATNVGVTHFVTKPFFVDEFITLVRSLLPHQASEFGM